MSDELESKNEQGIEDDAELMHDFQELFPEEESGGSADDESVDELDAFLDDFEKNLDIPDVGMEVIVEVDAGTDADMEAVADVKLDVGVDVDAIVEAVSETETVAEAETSADEAGMLVADELELGKSELDLDVGLDGEIYAEEVTLDEDEPELELGTSELDKDEAIITAEQAELEIPAADELAAAAMTAAAAAATASAAPAASAPAPIIPPAAAPSLSRLQFIGGTVLLSVSLLLSLVALWMGTGMASQIEALNQNVSELQQRVISQSRRGTIAPQAQLGEQLNRLGERVNELAVIIEGPVGHLRESSKLALDELRQRLDLLEQGQPVVAAADKGGVVPASSGKPLVSKTEPAPVAAVAPPTTKKAGWVINLMSVGSVKTADKELVRLRKLGIRADKQTVNQGGKTWYRLRVTGFDSYEGAKAYIDTVEKQTGFNSAWVAKG